MGEQGFWQTLRWGCSPQGATLLCFTFWIVNMMAQIEAMSCQLVNMEHKYFVTQLRYTDSDL